MQALKHHSGDCESHFFVAGIKTKKARPACGGAGLDMIGRQVPFGARMP
jgi:hypothetical protein